MSLAVGVITMVASVALSPALTASAQSIATDNVVSCASSYCQNVVYLTGAGHVEDLYYPLGGVGPLWKATDVTAQTGAPAAAPGSTLTSWTGLFDEFIAYMTSAGHVEDLYYPFGQTGPLWKASDVTAQAGAPPAAPGSNLTSFVDGTYQHVVYLTSAGHAEELYYPFGVKDPVWTANDATARAGAPSAAPGSALTSWADQYNRHIVYLTTTGHAEELYYQLARTEPLWKASDDTIKTSAPSAAPGSALTSWADQYNQHIVYLTTTGYAEELYYPLGKTGPLWKASDDTAQTSAPSAAPGSALTSWADQYNQHIVYLTTTGHAEELYYPLGKTGPLWKASDDTIKTSAPQAAPGSALTSWADQYNQHIVYLTTTGHAEELYYPLGKTGPLWKASDDTAQTRAPSAAPGSALTSWSPVGP